jgi:DNA mismatch repair protein MutL
MASRIRILPDHVANQIAAGEVVERPASVLKELVENALDAGATRLDLRWEEGGKRLLEVADDGSGLGRDDLYLALERHATSKVRTADDLDHLASFGFRGEALPSIAAVSRLDMRSAESDGAGFRLRCEFGTIREVTPFPRARGTTVTVQDLFAQLPARKRFLKGTDTEHAHLWGVVTRLALAAPHIHWTLRTDRGGELTLPPVAEPGERLGALLGERFQALQPFRNGEAPWTLQGYLSPPSLSFRDRSHLYLFVNGRSVRDRLLLSALAQAWEGFFPKGAFPAALLFLDLPPEAVDVNVHPTKAEVRFRDPGRVFSWVSHAAREAWDLLRGDPMSFQELPPRPVESNWDSPLLRQPPMHRLLWENPEPLPREAADRPYTFAPLEGHVAEAAPEEPGFRYLGSFQNTYLLVEIQGERGPELWIIDQHVAHERVLFERLFLRQHRPAIQPLMPPRILEVGPAALSRLTPWLAELQAVGVDVEGLSAGALVVRGLPDFLTDRDPQGLLEDLLTRLEEAGRLDLDHFRRELNAGLACRAAVKKHESLPEPQARHLIQDLLACEAPHTCPHGRPVMKVLSLADLERSFGRRG